MNKKRLEFLQEKAKQLNKTLLIEETSIISLDDVKIFDKSKLIESTDKHKYEALAIAENVPISGYGLNLNERIYSKPLWERVFKEGKWKQTFSLADHPSDDSDGSVKDIWGVWQDMRLEENGVFGTLFLIEEKPVKILKAGGSLGISTSGFGELEESDGKTVNPNTYSIERLGDIVMNPSQRTFMTLENINKSDQIQENLENKIVENTNKKMNESEIISIKKEEEEIHHMDKIEAANLKNSVRLALKEAKNTSNYKETIEELNEIKKLVPEELQETHVKIDSTLAELQEKMTEQIKNSEKAIQENEVKVKELTEKYDLATKTADELKEKYSKAKALLEKASVISPKDHKVLQENLVKIHGDLQKVFKERAVMMEDIKQMLKDRLSMNEDIKVLKTRLKKQIIEAKTVKKESEKSSKELKIAEAHIIKLEKILEDEYGYEFDDKDEEEPIVEEDMTTDGSDEEMPVTEEADEEGEPVEGEEKPFEGVDDETEIEIEEEEDPEAEYSIVDETDDMEDENYEMEDKPLEEEEETTAKEVEDSLESGELKEYVFGKSSKPKLSEAGKAKVAEKDKIKKIKESEELRKDILGYYKKAVSKNPAVKDIKGSIFKSKSLVEAVKLVESFKMKKNEMIKVDASKKFNAEEDYLGHRL